MKPKFIAFYLPQYHTIPENDKWWGKGFTEWERLKKAKPLFKNHYQPRVPYKYYDLSNVEEMMYQASIAQEYGVYGFCYYHYWFNGKLLLEKPLENMLKNKEVDIPFCLSWANEKWTRAWEGNTKEILIEQEYGGEKEWEEHFSYLLKYFKDKRYIKIDGKYVFLIYRTASFKEFDEMISFWNTKMKENGLSELFIIETLNSFQKKPTCINSDAVVEFEPMFTIGANNKIFNKIKRISKKYLFFFYKKSYKLFDYDNVLKKIIARNNNYNGKKVFLGTFTDWDNSPRFGSKGAIFTNVTPQKFGYYLSKQAKRSKTPYVFINAWNEWAEGAYLEPDKKNDLKLLKEIKKIKNSL
jgi:hypothetical protein